MAHTSAATGYLARPVRPSRPASAYPFSILRLNLVLYIYEVYIIVSSTVGATNRKMKHYGYKYKKNGLTCSVDD